MIDSSTYFAIYFKELPEPLSEIWGMFCEYLHVQVGLPSKWSVMEKGTLRKLKRSPREIGEIIDQQDIPGFYISTLGIEEKSITLTLGPAGGGMMHPDAAKLPGRVLFCRFEVGAKVPSSWHTLIEQISSRWITYGGFEWDHRYVGWQTTTWADDYEKIAGTLPPGMERKVIPSVDGLSPSRIQLDPSKNPGRQSVTNGQFRTVAAKMWLGNDFWKYSPSIRDEVANADFLIDSRNYPDFVYIHSYQHPFTRPDGEQGRIQQKLWRLLFHEDCEWPPGSGGISDEAVYGPPELMPDYVAEPPKVSVAVPPPLPPVPKDPMLDIDPLIRQASKNGDVTTDPWLLIPDEPVWKNFDGGTKLALSLVHHFEVQVGDSWCDSLDDVSVDSTSFTLFATMLSEAFRELALYFSLKIGDSPYDAPLAEELVNRFLSSASPARTPARMENLIILAGSYFGNCILREGGSKWMLLDLGEVRVPRIRWENSATCFPWMQLEGWIKTGKPLKDFMDALHRQRGVIQ